MHKTLAHCLSLTTAPLLLAFAFTMPVAAHAQSWTAGVHSLAEVPHGSATQAIVDMYMGGGQKWFFIAGSHQSDAFIQHKGTQWDQCFLQRRHWQLRPN